MKIKILLFAAFVIGATSVQAAPTTPNGRKPLGINLSTNIDYTPELHFVDLMKQSRPWNGTDFDAGPVSFPATSDGYPLQIPTASLPLVKTIMCTNIGGHYPAGTYTLVIEGHGTVVLVSDAQGTFQGPGTYQVPVTPTNSGVILEITYSDVNNPITGIHFILPGHGSTYQSDPLNPDFYQPLQGLSVLRFMDAMQVNTNYLNTTARYNWTAGQVIPPTYYTQGTTFGMSPEYIAMICNKVNADAWINIPAFADDSWVTTFAHKLHQNLNSNLTVYIEYSNELWNGGFYQGVDIGAKGVNCGSGYFAGTNGYHARRVSQIWQLFQNEWGNLSHIVRVAGAWFDNASYGDGLLSCFENATINPTSQRPDAMAVGAYFGYGLIGSSMADLEQQCVSDIQVKYANNVVGNKAVAKTHGVRLIAYEGGQHLLSLTGPPDPTQTAFEIAANRDAGIGPLYQQMFDTWYANGGELFQQYSYISDFDVSGSWGAMEYLGQTAAPKWQAIQKELASLGGGGGPPSSPTLSLNTTSMSFSGLVGANPASQTLTISNSGSGTLAWTASKTQAWLSLSVASGGNSGSIGVSVNTAGLGAGTYNDTITVTDPNASNSPRTVSLSLTLTNTTGSGLPVITAQPQNVTLVAGQTATFNVTATGGTSPTGGAAIAFAPPSLAFGSVVVGNQSAPQAMTVTNTGSAPLTISNITASSEFTQTNNCGTVAAGGSCAINVTFAPSATGARPGTITVTDNVSGSPQTVSLSGTGSTNPPPPGGQACVVFNTPDFTHTAIFPATAVGATSNYAATKNLLYNSCVPLLTISNVSIVGPNASDFAFSDLDLRVAASDANPFLSYVAGSGGWVDLSFTPGAAGGTTRTATLVITDNDTGGQTTEPLIGTVSGVTASIGVSVAISGLGATAQDASGLIYQWQVLSGGQWVNDTTDAGATSATLTIANAQPAQSGTQYRVIVTNNAGSVTSSPAVLTVTPATGNCTPISFVAGSVAPVTVAPNASFSMSCDYGKLMNSIVPLPGSGSCTVFTGFTGTAANFNCTAGSVGGTFANSCSVIAMSPYNFCPRTDAINSTVVQGANQAPAITGQPQNASVTAGQSATFTVTATANPSPTYQWQVLSSGQWVNDTTDAGNTSTSLTINNSGVAQSGTSYRVVVTNNAGSVTSAPAVLTVTPPTTTAIGTMVVAGDDQYFAYANGAFLGTGNYWPTPQTYSFPIVSGTNVVSFQAKNIGTANPAGILADITAGSAHFGTSTSCKITATDPGSGWTALGYNDSAWSNAVDEAAYGGGPWGSFSSALTGTPAHWIWACDTNGSCSTNTPTPVWVRCSFQGSVPPPPVASGGTVVVSADDDYTAYANGAVLGTGHNWTGTQSYNFPVASGANVVAFQADNVGTGNPAGLIADISAGTFHFGTNTSCKITTANPGSGWAVPSFDDSAWANAVDEGAYGAGPWGAFSSSLSGTAAHWIWSCDTSGSCAANPPSPVWVRCSFNSASGQQPGTTTPLQITAPSTSLTVRVRPNPFRASQGVSTIVFDQMTADSTVKLFTISAEWIKTLQADSSGLARWDLTNDTGDKVASGLYLYLVTDHQGNKTRGKLAIIR